MYRIQCQECSVSSLMHLQSGRWGLYWKCTSCKNVVDLKAWGRQEAAIRKHKWVVRFEMWSSNSFSLSSGMEVELRILMKLWMASSQSRGGERYDENVEDDETTCYIVALEHYDCLVEFVISCVSITNPWIVDVIPKPTLQYFQQLEEVAPASTATPLREYQGLTPHQLEGVQYILRHRGRVLLADEMGTGKTVQAVMGIDGLGSGAFPCLVVCPAALRIHWATHWEKWAPHMITNPTDIRIIFSSNDRPSSEDHSKVCITSYTMLRNLSEYFTSVQWGSIVVDESHIMRVSQTPGDAGSQLTMLLSTIVAKTQYALLLTGTPSVNKPFDLWAQVNSLRPGLLGETKFDFVLSYFGVETDSTQPSCFASKCRRSRELNLLMQHALMIRRTKKEVMPYLPPKIREEHRVPLQCAGITRPEGGLASSDFQTLYHTVGLAKTDSSVQWIIEWLERNGGDNPLVVFAHHLHVLDALSSTVGAAHPHIRIDGSTPTSVRPGLIESFNSRQVRVAIIGVTAAGLGVDLSSASTCVFVEIPPDRGWMRQAEDRLHRRGQEGTVTVHILIGCPQHDVQSSSDTFESRLVALEERAWARMALREVNIEEVIDHDHHRQKDHDEARSPVSQVPPPSSILTQPSSSLLDQSFLYTFTVSYYTRRIYVFREDKLTSLEINLTRAEAMGMELPGCEEYMARYDFLTPYEQKLNHGVVGRLPKTRRDFGLTSSSSPPQACAKKRPRYLENTRCLLDDDDGASNHERLAAATKWVQREVMIPALKRRCKFLQGYRGDVPLCGWCGNDLEQTAPDDDVPSDMSLFCCGQCRGEYFIRRSSGAVRQQVFQLDQGVCRQCNVDCVALGTKLNEVPRSQREGIVLSYCPEAARYPHILKLMAYGLTQGSLWQADHIVPVKGGGGCCGLENLQTLCSVCHWKKTMSE
eukprot:PhF_6_TR26185/c0_g1_i2/m.37228